MTSVTESELMQFSDPHGFKSDHAAVLSTFDENLAFVTANVMDENTNPLQFVDISDKAKYPVSHDGSNTSKLQTAFFSDEGMAALKTWAATDTDSTEANTGKKGEFIAICSTDTKDQVLYKIKECVAETLAGDVATWSAWVNGSQMQKDGSIQGDRGQIVAAGINPLLCKNHTKHDTSDVSSFMHQWADSVVTHQTHIKACYTPDKKKPDNFTNDLTASKAIFDYMCNVCIKDIEDESFYKNQDNDFWRPCANSTTSFFDMLTKFAKDNSKGRSVCLGLQECGLTAEAKTAESNIVAKGTNLDALAALGPFMQGEFQVYFAAKNASKGKYPELAVVIPTADFEPIRAYSLNVTGHPGVETWKNLIVECTHQRSQKKIKIVNFHAKSLDTEAKVIEACAVLKEISEIDLKESFVTVVLSDTNYESKKNIPTTFGRVLNEVATVVPADDVMTSTKQRGPFQLQCKKIGSFVSDPKDKIIYFPRTESATCQLISGNGDWKTYFSTHMPAVPAARWEVDTSGGPDSKGGLKKVAGGKHRSNKRRSRRVRGSSKRNERTRRASSKQLRRAHSTRKARHR